MKKTAAVFQTPYGSVHLISSFEHYEGNEAMEQADKSYQKNGYVRLTEWTEIELKELKKVDLVSAEINFLDKQLQEAEQKFDEVKARVDRRKSELLAITYQG